MQKKLIHPHPQEALKEGYIREKIEIGKYWALMDFHTYSSWIVDINMLSLEHRNLEKAKKKKR